MFKVLTFDQFAMSNCLTELTTWLPMMLTTARLLQRHVPPNDLVIECYFMDVYQMQHIHHSDISSNFGVTHLDWSHFLNFMYHLQTLNWSHHRLCWVRLEKDSSLNTKLDSFHLEKLYLFAELCRILLFFGQCT